MFWKRIPKTTPAVITSYGAFVWDGTFAWSCEHRFGNQQLSLVSVGGQFDPVALSRFGQALQHLEELTQDALAANRTEIESYGHRIDQMSLSGLCIDPFLTTEDMQLDFSFQNWPDGALTVHFKAREIVGSHIDD